MDLLLPLAQAASDASTIPEWAKYVLGPLGALVLLLVYAIYTEKYRLPELKKLLVEYQTKIGERCPRGRFECETIRGKMRKAYEAREDKLEKRLRNWMSRHSREKTRRIFFQTEAHRLAKQAGEDTPKLPDEISATSYEHRPLPRDPDPDSFEDDAELPEIPDF